MSVLLRDRRAWLGVLIGAILISGIVLTLNMRAARSGPPSTTSSSSSSNPLSSSLACAQGEDILALNYELDDAPGGFLTPAQAMGSFLSQHSSSLTLIDVSQVVVVDSNNTEYARYQYKSALGSTIILFDLNVIGDSWHVSGVQACSDQVQGVLMTTYPDAPGTVRG